MTIPKPDFCGVQHIDLSKGIPQVIEDTSIKGVFAVFWWRDIPLGHRLIFSTELPLNANKLQIAILQSIAPAINAYFSERGLSSPLAANEAHLAKKRYQETEIERMLKTTLERFDNLAVYRPSQNKQKKLSICVIIPTYKRTRQLTNCLRSIQNLSEKPDEVIVVDNAPQSSVIFDLIAQKFPEFRYMPEHRTGASVARNSAVRNTNAILIAFVDDDETVHPNWLTWLRQNFHDSSTDIVTGLVLPAELQTEAQYIYERRYSYIRGYQTKHFDDDFYLQMKQRGGPVWQMGGSCNMAIRREVFEQLGGFNELLGSSVIANMEDCDLLLYALKQGCHCRYEPRAITYHKHRRDMDILKQHLYSHNEGHTVVTLMEYAKHKNPANLRYLFWTLPKLYVRHFLHSFTGNPIYSPDLLLKEIAGFFSGLRFYWRYREMLNSRIKS